jgi:hypothetical protein
MGHSAALAWDAHLVKKLYPASIAFELKAKRYRNSICLVSSQQNGERDNEKDLNHRSRTGVAVCRLSVGDCGPAWDAAQFESSE